MNRPWQIWLSYSAALAIVVAAVGLLSVRALDSERAEEASRRQAAVEENVRLALWRMDSSLAAFLAQENSRPYEAYQTLLVSSASRMNGTLRMKPATAPRAGEFPPQVRLYFCTGPDGRFEALPPPTEPAIGVESTAAVADERLVSALDELRRTTTFDRLFGELPPPPETSNTVVMINSNSGSQLPPPEPLVQGQAMQQQQRAAIEYNARAFSFNNQAFGNNTTRSATDPIPGPPIEARVGIFAPFVLGDGLMLARQAKAAGQRSIQGAVLDWPVLRGDLRAAINDLLPEAQLEIVPAESTELDRGRLLASLPVRLDPGHVPFETAQALSPVRQSLLIAWGAMLLAAAAVAVLLRGVVTLSERRADFVSAVTHELRTPLTTFRMYAEMLADGMVPDESRRRQYLDTLRIEADRLMHLVENVLAYARLERGGLGNRVRTVDGRELLSAATTRLEERAAQSDLVLAIDADEEALAALVLADPSAVEQILFNLVDNACKYAKPSGDDESARTLELQARKSAERFVLRLRDHGPGLTPERQALLFRPFRKSASAAAESAPGVGLGLSLSRRLARDMGGELRFDPTVRDGAAFELTLRRK